MKVCTVEGCNGKVHSKGYCDKHYRQYKRYGKIRRTNKDPNEIIVHEDYAEIILYDKNCNEKDRALIDLDDVYKVKQYKWCLDAYGYVIGGKNNKIVGYIRIAKYQDNEKEIQRQENTIT